MPQEEDKMEKEAEVSSQKKNETHVFSPIPPATAEKKESFVRRGPDLWDTGLVLKMDTTTSLLKKSTAIPSTTRQLPTHRGPTDWDTGSVLKVDSTDRVENRRGSIASAVVLPFPSKQKEEPKKESLSSRLLSTLPEEKKKVTYYFPQELSENLHRVYYFLRKKAPLALRSKVSKSAMMELALQAHIEDYHKKGMHSAFVRSLLQVLERGVLEDKEVTGKATYYLATFVLEMFEDVHYLLRKEVEGSLKKQITKSLMARIALQDLLEDFEKNPSQSRFSLAFFGK